MSESPSKKPFAPWLIVCLVIGANGFFMMAGIGITAGAVIVRRMRGVKQVPEESNQVS